MTCKIVIGLYLFLFYINVVIKTFVVNNYIEQLHEFDLKINIRNVMPLDTNGNSKRNNYNLTIIREIFKISVPQLTITPC